MARYVDGFVLHGAVTFIESAGDDLQTKMGLAFGKLAKLKPGETVFYSFNRVNKKVMADPRLKDMMDMSKMPFDPKRMAYGGFRTLVDLEA